MSSNVWWTKDQQLGLGILSSGTVTPITTVTAVRYGGIKYADDYTDDLSEESGLPEEYDRALLAGVMRDYAEEEKDFKTANYWRGVHDDLRREAKREANIRKDGTPYGVTAEGY